MNLSHQSFRQQVVERYPALGSMPYRRFWLASFASVGATRLITLGQGWLVYELTDSALQLGILGAAASLPNIAMTLFGGVIADRFDKRQILQITSAAIAILLFVLAVLDALELVQVWHVVTIAALFSLITGLDWPTREAIYPSLVPRPAFMSAVALNSFTWQSTRMAVPALGGLLIYLSDTWLIFALSGCGFLIMFMVISSLHIALPKPTEHSPIEQLQQGLVFIWQTQIFRWLIGLTFAGMLFANSYIQILPVFVGLMGSSEQGYGYLLSATGIGSIIGTLLVGSLDHDKPLGRYMFAGTALSVVALIGFVGATHAGSFVLALIAVFFVALCGSVYIVISVTILQMQVPDELRGRVMGIHTIGYSLMSLGGLLLGYMAQSVGPGQAVLLSAGVYSVILVAVWVTRSDLRQAGHQHHSM
ncbi:MAG: MFS transporter [Pseudomonadales bacterium]|jgi:MFS family permease|nr:MFS transporter [Pseudomonadales bacterium]